MPGKIILAGEGGQGVQTIAKTLALAGKKSEKNTTYLPSFGVEQRGGVSVAYIKISDRRITYPRFYEADIAVCFCNRAIEIIKDFVTKETLFIYDSSLIDSEHLEKIKNRIGRFLAIPAHKMAQKNFSTKMANMVILGAISIHLKEIDFSAIEKEVLKELKDKIAKDPSLEKMVISALKAGVEFSQKFDYHSTELKGAQKKEIEGTFQKEGISWTRFPEYCKGCGLCITECPVGAISFSSDSGFLGNPLPIVDISKCIGCGKCQKICPDGAIRVEKKPEK